MAKLGMGEIFALIKKEKSTKAKADLLRKYDSKILRGILELAYDVRVEWALPEGMPPYKPLEKSMDAQGYLLAEMRRMYLFLKNGNPNLTALRREQLFISLLEEIDCDDAALIVECKNRKIEGVPKKLVLDTFPDFLTDDQNRPPKK